LEPCLERRDRQPKEWRAEHEDGSRLRLKRPLGFFLAAVRLECGRISHLRRYQKARRGRDAKVSEIMHISRKMRLVATKPKTVITQKSVPISS
jgi:hypothetical protein